MKKRTLFIFSALVVLASCNERHEKKIKKIMAG
ncbi:MULTISPECIES: lipoprotein [unclassified Chryseobacterium]|nr:MULTISPECIES: lipoprotein [unclassified Chryseobacterium]